MGIPDEELADPRGVGEENRCPICMQVLSDPLEGICEHLFCQECIMHALQFRHQCPVCREDLYPEDLGVAHRHVRATLDKIVVKCPKQPQCTWVGRLDQRPGHACLDQRLELLTETVAERDAKIQLLERAVKDRDRAIEWLETELAEREAQVDQLETELCFHPDSSVPLQVREFQLLCDLGYRPHSEPVLRVGESYCLVDSAWYSTWFRWVVAPQLTVELAAWRPPGAIDNRGLLDESNRLKAGALAHEHYEVLLPDAWDLLVAHHGGGPRIERRACRGPAGRVVLALGDLDLRIYRSSVPSIVQAVLSEPRTTSVAQLKVRACRHLGLAPDRVRLWDFYGQKHYGMLESPPAMTLEARRIVNNNDILLEEMAADGTWPLDAATGPRST